MEIDPYETCPYDPVHRIRRSRMQFHITICSKNFPSSKMMQCPFDARHKVNQVEFEYHKNHCPARESVMNYAIHDAASQSEQKILPIDVNPVGVSDENWDEGANVKTYNPLQAIRDKPIVFPIVGLSKAQRKNHRMQERIRFNQIMEISGNSSKSQAEIPPKSSVVKRELPPKKSVNNEDEEYKPLRRPFHVGNKSISTQQDKGQNRSPSENLKKILREVNKTSNVPMSYAAALSNDDISPTLNKFKDNDSVIDKLSRTFEEIVVNDEGHKKKTGPLNQELIMMWQKKYKKK